MKRSTLILMTVVIVALCGISGILFRNLMAHSGRAAAQDEEPSSGPRDHVALTPEKFAAAGIVVTAVSKRELSPNRIVPGHIEYNATRHVQLKTPFDGLVRSVEVKVGDRVTEGQVLGIVDSPELGEKRADVLLRENELQQAKNEHDWWHAVQENVDELIARLKRPQDMVQLEKDFADKPLGEFREKIFGAYSSTRLRDKLSSNLKSAADSGAVSGRMKLETDSARDIEAAKFVAACEQAAFDVKQKHLKAEGILKVSDDHFMIAKQRLSLLVNQPQEALSETATSTSLSTWQVKAPFDATVEEVLLPPKERVQTGQGLFQLADTSRLWVHADIREKDWSALSIGINQKVSVQTPALPGKTLEATVAFVGRTVEPESRSVPLTANIDNKAGLLRPGMFVRVLIPFGQPHECLTVPQSAIAVNEGKSFVFVETGEREYHPRFVTTGLTVDPWIEITSGLEEGDRVVTSGAAILKAELLLEPED